MSTIKIKTYQEILQDLVDSMRVDINWCQPTFDDSPKPSCDCGGHKAENLHAYWCKTNETI